MRKDIEGLYLKNNRVWILLDKDKSIKIYL